MRRVSSSTPKDGPLTAHVGFWLRFVSNHVSGAFRQKLSRKEVSVAEWALMRELFEHGGVAPSQLAARLGMTRGGVTKIADKLVARAFVTRTADPIDHRAHTLGLTAAGRRLVPVLVKIADRNDAEFFGHLPVKTKQTLTTILRDLAKHHHLGSVPVD